MKILLINTLLVLTLFGDNVKNSYVGGILTYNTIFNLEQKQRNSKLQLNLQMDKWSSKWGNGISTNIGYFKTYKPIYNQILRDQIPRQEYLELNEFYVYQQFNKLLISIGVLPFKNGTFSNYSWNSSTVGNGLFTIMDQSPEGFILAYKVNDDLQFAGGKLWLDKFMNIRKPLNSTSNAVMNLDTPEHKLDITKSNGEFFTCKWKNSNVSTEFDYFNLKFILNDIQVTYSNIIAYGLSYDDIADSGFVYYSILSLSETKGNSSSLNPTKQTYMNDIYHFGPIDTKGGSILLGIKKYLDLQLFSREFAVGFEYFKSTPGNISMNLGKPSNLYGYANYGDLYNIWAEAQITSNIDVKLRYSMYKDNDTDLKIGGITETTTAINPGNSKLLNSIIFQINYKF